jgi:hypothetical protein
MFIKVSKIVLYKELGSIVRFIIGVGVVKILLYFIK